MATFKAIVFTGGKHIKQDGTANIKIRIYHNSSSMYIATEYFIKPDLMGDDGTIASVSEQAEILNYELTKNIQSYREVCIKLGSERTKRMTCSELKEEILLSVNCDSQSIDFVQFAKELISKTVKVKTAEWYDNSLNSFMNFFKKQRIDTKDITVKNLELYIEHLMNTKIVVRKKNMTMIERNMEPGTINNYIRGLRAIYNKAKKQYNNEELDIIRIPSNPFVKISIPQYRRKRKNLSIEDIIRIRDGNFTTSRANMAKDVFMMMFYLMGININDLYLLSSERMGRVEYERSKTNTPDNIGRFTLSIKVEPELRLLLDKYSNGVLLSAFKNKYCCLNNFLRAVNIGLKTISEELNLGVPLSTNWARHSWASIARNKAGINKADIDFCLGHVNHEYKMADIYIDIDYSIYDKANRSVLDLLQKKQEKNS